MKHIKICHQNNNSKRKIIKQLNSCLNVYKMHNILLSFIFLMQMANETKQVSAYCVFTLNKQKQLKSRKRTGFRNYMQLKRLVSALAQPWKPQFSRSTLSLPKSQLCSAPKSHLCDQKRRSKLTGLSDIMTLFIDLGRFYCKQTQRAFNVFKSTLNWLKIDSVDLKLYWLECGNFSQDAEIPGTERVIAFSQLAVKGLSLLNAHPHPSFTPQFF
jgi:hypothetical protein